MQAMHMSPDRIQQTPKRRSQSRLQLCGAPSLAFTTVAVPSDFCIDPFLGHPWL